MKEFDIFLNKRLTECDVIVYSIPYRDGLTVVNRMILESCLESYTLQKFVAVQFGSELVAHIDEMIKTCYERLGLGVGIGASAEFQKLYTACPKEIGMEIAQEKVKLLSISFTDAESALQIAVAPLAAQIAKSAGGGSTGVVMNQSVRGTLKSSIEKFVSSTQILADVSNTVKRTHNTVDNRVEFCSELADLCYRFYTGANTAVQIAAAVLGTELHYSLGYGKSGIVIGADVSDGDYATKYETVSNVVSVLAEAIESIVQIVSPPEHKILILSEASFIKRRYRLLYEMDPDTLISYDNMSLDDVDYVIL